LASIPTPPKILRLGLQYSPSRFPLASPIRPFSTSVRRV